MTESASTLPFFEIFTRLIAEKIPLEIRDYCDLGIALQGQFGIDLEYPDDPAKQEAAFKSLCLLLWTRTTEEAAVFETIWNSRKQEIRILLQQKIIQPPPIDEIDSTAVIEKEIAERTKNNSLPPLPPPPPEERALSSEMEESMREMPLPAVDSNNSTKSYQPSKVGFRFTDDCYDLTFRQMCQAWRKLNRPSKVGLSDEIDLPQTISQVARTGMVGEPVFLPRYRDTTQLLLLIDSNGSMLPFKGLCEQIRRAAVREGGFSAVHTYYFSNYPEDTLYRDPQQYEPVAREKIWPFKGYSPNLAILLISDAGAVRGTFEPGRVIETQRFLRQMMHRSPRSAWINPMPRTRWARTSAQFISRDISMHEATAEGFRAAIEHLK